MNHVVVAVVADLNVLEAELVEDLLPGLPLDEGGGVHGAPVSDDQDILGTAHHAQVCLHIKSSKGVLHRI